MAKRKKQKTRSIGNIKLSQRNILIIIAIIGIGVAAIFTVPLLFQVFAPPGEGGTGYMEFQFLDPQTGKELDGEVVLIPVNETDEKFDFDDYAETEGLYDNPLETGEVVFVPEPCLAVVYDVDLKKSDDRDWFPQTISPIGGNTEEEAVINTFSIQFYTDVNDIEANLTEIDGNEVEWDSSLSDLPVDEKFDLRVSVNVSTDFDNDNAYPSYGATSYIPEWYLEKKGYDLNIEEDLLGFGLYLCFNDSEVAYANVEDNGADYTEKTYIDSLDIGMILLDVPIAENESYIDLKLELKSTPTEVFIFEGFLSDIADTRIPLFIK